MSSPREQFDALMRAAAAARSGDFDATPAYGLETRVLAAWRGSRSAPILETGVLLRGLIVAGLLMLVSIVPAIEQTANSDSENLQVADTTVQTDFMP